MTIAKNAQDTETIVTERWEMIKFIIGFILGAWIGAALIAVLIGGNR